MPSCASPSWGPQSIPSLASSTPSPSHRCAQDPGGLRMGRLVSEQDYERLEDCDPEGSRDSPLHGEEQQPLLHVPEGLRGSWHHIQNLDTFFTNISFVLGHWSYHQRNGFTCILLEDVFQLGQFLFIVTFTTFLLRCVDYDILFANQPNNHTKPWPVQRKVALSDAILPSAQCAERIHASPLLVFLLILAACYWLFQLLRSLRNLFSYWDIQVFYREALHITPEELSSVPWAEVQSRLLELQRSGGLCVQPRPLTELDVHHRILRYTNYQVALANKGLLPAHCPLPWGGSVAFLSRGLALNVDLLLFRGPFSLFRGGWELPEAYKRSDQRGALAARWGRTVLLLAAVNMALSPVVLAWQLLFFAGALFAALLLLTVYDEDVLTVEHVFTTMTALGLVATVARCFLPEEQGQGRPPQLLLQAALAHMHYFPEEPGCGGRDSNYRQMSQLLQYRAASLLEELLSPVLTPLFLLLWFRPRALEFIDFFHHFTVDVAGVGDICSFALMDVKRHGHPQWLSEGQTEASVAQRAENGKTELSLMRFSLAHPQWRPPGDSSKFLGHLRGRVQQDAAAWGTTSARSPPTPGVLSDCTSPLHPDAFLANLLVNPILPPRDMSPTATRPAAATASVLASISRITQDPSCVSPGGTGGQKLVQLPELASAEMSLHAIYLHQLHQQQQQELWGEASASSPSRAWSSPSQPASPDEEKPSWSSDGSSPASSPRQQWGKPRAQNLFPEGFQETVGTQREPGQGPGTD
ncbi:Autophagy-related protein 9B [Fukomys damarensis]|uniref:Autophagy-related protein 9 n=1 Tax=Fukomys damarensis TaxID=885580 RepID=A0A091DAX0_FUKDA|nr:Autophagy-related protein 9B [Fukomys damarensis]